VLEDELSALEETILELVALLHAKLELCIILLATLDRLISEELDEVLEELDEVTQLS
jgi:hypothetical protein